MAQAENVIVSYSSFFNEMNKNVISIQFTITRCSYFSFSSIYIQHTEMAINMVPTYLLGSKPTSFNSTEYGGPQNVSFDSYGQFA